VVGWVDDLRALVDELGLRRFVVLGWSAGAAYALACGYALAERVIAVGLASPAAGWFVGRGAQPDVHVDLRRLAAVAGSAAWWFRLLLGGLRRQIRSHPERLVVEEASRLPSADREILARSDMRRMMAASLVEQFSQGVTGVVDEALALARPWGFDPARVPVPVLLWHGESDIVVSPGAVRRLASRLPTCRATYYAGEGHYLVLARWHQILASLTAAARGER
jgi:pimeloyl-ACP methyl ester carboxylesterase